MEISIVIIESYEKGLNIACDNEFIYLNRNGVYSENLDYYIENNIKKETFFLIDIYDYEGRLLETINLMGITEHRRVAQYFCSTKDFLFIGEVSYPLSRGLYAVPKDEIGKNKQINIYKLK